MLNFNKVKIPKEIKVDPRFEKLPLRGIYLTSLILSLLFLVFGFVSVLILPPEIPIFYGLPKTNEQLGRSIFIILPTAVSSVLITINAIVAINLESQYLKRVLAFTSMLISILAIITTFKIITLVGSI